MSRGLGKWFKGTSEEASAPAKMPEPEQAQPFDAQAASLSLMQQLHISGAPNSAQQQNMFAPAPGQSILASIGGNAGQPPSHIGGRSANGAPNAGQSIMAMLGGGSTVQAQGNGMPQLPPLPSDARTVDSIAPSGYKLPPLPSIAAFPDDGYGSPSKKPVQEASAAGASPNNDLMKWFGGSSASSGSLPPLPAMSNDMMGHMNAMGRPPFPPGPQQGPGGSGYGPGYGYAPGPGHQGKVQPQENDNLAAWLLPALKGGPSAGPGVNMNVSALPPLPTVQGVKILSVEEIEQRKKTQPK